MRIGPKMLMARDYIERHPGCTKLAAARFAMPHNGLQYGYATINRAINAGLIRAENLGDRYALYVIEQEQRR